MNKNLENLFAIASKKHRLIIGLMSGTSLDGLDVALCGISGYGINTKLELLKFETIQYDEETKVRIKEVFAKPQVDLIKLTNLNSWIGILHGKIVLKCLEKWKVSVSSVDCIASHGQTVMHVPSFLNPYFPVNSTLQIGDGDHIATTTGIMTISDFRQKHIATGGQGAPLAVYLDYILCSSQTENRILLNIGGIANFTFLPMANNSKSVFVTDTGPGNTLIDQTVYYHFNEYFDRDAKRAKAGLVHDGFLKALKSDAFFQLPFPKTTGPELFNLEYLLKAQRQSNSENLSYSDVLATLTRFSAETIVSSIRQVVKNHQFVIYVSGGGAHNPLLMNWLKELLGVSELHRTFEIGIDGDAKEAILFAVLANETIVGEKIEFNVSSNIPTVQMGKISFPD